MKFIVDVQLPRRLAQELAARGHDSRHSSDLPLGNRSADEDITAVAIKEDRIVVTKDADFVTSFLLRGVPPKLLLVSTGNIANDELRALFSGNLAALEGAFANASFVEISRTTLTVHG